jgi:hypothetical protein
MQSHATIPSDARFSSSLGADTNLFGKLQTPRAQRSRCYLVKVGKPQKLLVKALLENTPSDLLAY